MSTTLGKDAVCRRLCCKLLCPLAFCLALTSHAMGGRRPQARLQGYDVLAVSGQTIELKAKVEAIGIAFFTPDLSGETVEFWYQDTLIGTSISAGEGMARLQIRASQAGDHIVSVRLSSESAYVAAPSQLLVAVRESDIPAIVTDIDHTIADVTGLEFLVLQNDQVPTVQGSETVLATLKDTYLIIYVTARDDTFTDKTKAWLKLRNFPQGPTYFWNFDLHGGTPLSHEAYKSGVIRRLKATFPRILVGVGDKNTDAVSYLSNGLRAYSVRGGPEDPAFPEDTIFVHDWYEMEDHLVRHPLF
ncbi:MAG: hypothetical protein KDD51_09025 [Bdellovibrionales bacterium]|nr:hypothetical protein [Bdellovibrionales bacterium]